jgi:hypothetical protein
MHPEKNVSKLVVLMLRASAVFLEALAKSFRKWANLLNNEVENT